MSTELLVFLLIVLLAVVLIAGGLFLSRRGGGAPPAAPRPPDLEAPSRPVPPEAAAPAAEAPPAALEEAVEEELAPVRERPRLRDRLGKTRAAFSGALTRRGKVDPETWDELEEALLLADVGMPTTQRILEDVKTRAVAEKAADSDQVLALLKDELTLLLEPGRPRAAR